jgi:hypothetical protein
MKTTPSPEELAAIAAKLDPKLSPDEAIAKAQALWEAAHKALRATQIADEEEEKRLLAEGERLERIGLGLHDEKIPVFQALALARKIASRMGVAFNYKTENGFANALRKAQLTIQQDISDKTVKEWLKSEEPERPIRETQEITSERAIEEFFKLRAEQKKRQDRARKAASNKKDKKKCRGIPRAKNGTNPPKSGIRKQKAEAGNQIAEARITA